LCAGWGIGHGAARCAGIFRVRDIRAGQSGTETTVLGKHLFQRDKIQLNSWFKKTAFPNGLAISQL
jgi:hypothetical protein